MLVQGSIGNLAALTLSFHETLHQVLCLHMLPLGGASAVLNLLDLVRYEYVKTPAFVVDVAQNHLAVGHKEVLMDWVIKLSGYLLAILMEHTAAVSCRLSIVTDLRGPLWTCPL